MKRKVEERKRSEKKIKLTGWKEKKAEKRRKKITEKNGEEKKEMKDEEGED